jgi:short-subunit dehydrogenase
MQAVVPIMRERGGGAIVNVSSGTSRMVLPGVGAYAATKAALNMLSLVAREEFATDGIVDSLGLPFGHRHGVPRQIASWSYGDRRR